MVRAVERDSRVSAGRRFESARGCKSKKRNNIKIMRLTISVTDYELDDKKIHPAMAATIDGDSTNALMCDKGNKASVQCERFERLAKEIAALIKGFYAKEVVGSEALDKV